jgi:ferritin-like protein
MSQLKTNKQREKLSLTLLSTLLRAPLSTRLAEPTLREEGKHFTKLVNLIQKHPYRHTKQNV